MSELLDYAEEWDDYALEAEARGDARGAEKCRRRAPSFVTRTG